MSKLCPFHFAIDSKILNKKWSFCKANVLRRLSECHLFVTTLYAQNNCLFVFTYTNSNCFAFHCTNGRSAKFGILWLFSTIERHLKLPSAFLTVAGDLRCVRKNVSRSLSFWKPVVLTWNFKYTFNSYFENDKAVCVKGGCDAQNISRPAIPSYILLFCH